MQIKEEDFPTIAFGVQPEIEKLTIGKTGDEVVNEVSGVVRRGITGCPQAFVLHV